MHNVHNRFAPKTAASHFVTKACRKELAAEKKICICTHASGYRPRPTSHYFLISIWEAHEIAHQFSQQFDRPRVASFVTVRHCRQKLKTGNLTCSRPRALWPTQTTSSPLIAANAQPKGYDLQQLRCEPSPAFFRLTMFVAGTSSTEEPNHAKVTHIDTVAVHGPDQPSR
jgi:hypothetical protein